MRISEFDAGSFVLGLSACFILVGFFELISGESDSSHPEIVKPAKMIFPLVRTTVGDPGDSGIFRDMDTGCEYIWGQHRNAAGLALRYDRFGRPSGCSGIVDEKG